ncbi:B12-binding domain-containing radical SAM protein [Limibacter armeniacum]|uniref:B12-binding domain-containing radical SAM protein n=1 Tax=Limibacter armeniacum TaxID=466084 RepID=UPI002FE58BBC
MKTLLITPPLTQLNTPYPATAYLKGYLNRKGETAFQADLGIELVLKMFSRSGLERIFDAAEEIIDDCSANAQRIFYLQDDYIDAVEPVIHFLQNSDSTFAHSICSREVLPEAKRFKQLYNMDVAFGQMGITDKAKYLATLFLEDLGDFIIEAISPHFGFSRYAESIAMSASSFDPIEEELNEPLSLLDELLLELLEEKIQSTQPDFIAFTVPFPGNLYGALKCGQYLKAHYPDIKIAMGGGYANTELRDLTDPRVFDYLDFITLDDGEGPIMQVIKLIKGEVKPEHLQRTFIRNEQGKVEFVDFKMQAFVPHSEVGTPDYTGLPLDKYLSVIEVANPMHRLWNDGRWNKLTVAHGCYWKKCSFCDVSLDYIGRYDGAPAKLLVDRIEELINTTGQTGFHFVDEAAPPLALRDLSLELIRRGIKITWWANIRFEKTFSEDLCKLMASAGCIAVSGGLEVASDRLLKMMKKGVDIEQVARVTNSFMKANIMVHAYLMYGFPTQTEQETIDSLEIVRQLFEHNCIQSGYWHRFSMTAHAPIGLEPEKFGVKRIGPDFGGFAKNDYDHEDPTGADHGIFTEGLKLALFNYMHGAGMEHEVEEWFDFATKPTTHHQHLISDAIHRHKEQDDEKLNNALIWMGKMPFAEEYKVKKKGSIQTRVRLTFFGRKEDLEVTTTPEEAEWLIPYLEQSHVYQEEPANLKEMKESYESHFGRPFKKFVNENLWQQLRKNGLLLIRL